MATLTEQERVRVWEKCQRENVEQWGAVTRQNLKAAVDALDQWLEDNKAGANQALPEPARSELTPAQKALLLTVAIERRYLTGA